MNKKQYDFCVKLFIAVLVFSCTGVVCFGQSLDIETYKREFGKKWIEYLHALGNVEGCIHYKIIGDGMLKREFTNCLVAAYPLLADIRGPFDAPLQVRVTGKEYGFELLHTESADADDL